jgi:hypothetical protein
MIVAALDLNAALREKAIIEGRGGDIAALNAKNVAESMEEYNDQLMMATDLTRDLGVQNTLSIGDNSRIIGLREEAEALQKKIRLAQKEGDISKEQAQLFLDEATALKQKRKGLIEELGLRDKITRAEFQDLRNKEAARQANDRDKSAEAEKIIRLKEAAVSYENLTKSLKDGTIGNENFVQGVNNIRDSLGDVIPNAAELSQAMDDIASGRSFDIGVNFSPTGVEDVMEVQQRIKEQEDALMLSKLSGTERLRKEEELRIQQFNAQIEKEQNDTKVAAEEKIARIKLIAEEDIRRVKNTFLIETDADKEKRDRVIESINTQKDTDIASVHLVLTEKLAALDTEEAREKELSQLKLDSIDKEIQAIQSKVAATLDSANKQESSVKKLISLENDLQMEIDETNQKRAGVVTRSGGQSKFLLSKKNQPQEQTTTTNIPPRLSSFGSPITRTPFQSGLSGFRQAAAGIRDVKHDALVKVHQGERILNRSEVRGGGGSQAPVIINLIDEKMLPQIMAKHPNAIVNPILHSMMNNPVTQSVMKQVVRR